MSPREAPSSNSTFMQAVRRLRAPTRAASTRQNGCEIPPFSFIARAFSARAPAVSGRRATCARRELDFILKSQIPQIAARIFHQVATLSMSSAIAATDSARDRGVARKLPDSAG